MAKLSISLDLTLMLLAAAFFTAVGFVTGATFFVILCGACLGLILIEIVTHRGHVTE